MDHVLVILSFVAPAFIATDHSRMRRSRTTTPLAGARRLDEGQLKRQLGFAWLLGSAFVFSVFSSQLTAPRSINISVLSPFVLAAYFLISIAWGSNRRLSLRRFLPLLVLVLVAYFIAKTISANQCARLLAWYGTVSVVFGYITLGVNFRSSRNDLGAGMHPNQRGAVSAIAVLSAIGLLANGYTVEGLSLAAFHYFVIIATRSRIAFWALNCAVGVFCLSMLPSDQASQFAFATAFAIVIFGLALGGHLGGAVRNAFSRLVLVGRTKSDLKTLNGRLRLWYELLNLLRIRWCFGYGYGAFWTRDRVNAIFVKTRWPFSDSHSCYIEAAINGGILGTLFWVSTVFGALHTDADSVARAAPSVIAFITFVGLHGLAEATFALPNFAFFALLLHAFIGIV